MIFNLNPIDLAYIVVMAFGIYRGVKLGFIGTVIGFFKFTVAIIFALATSDFFTRVFDKLIINDAYNIFIPLLSFMFAFIVAMGFMYFVGETMNVFVKAANLNSLNTALGVVSWGFLLTFAFSYLVDLAMDRNIISMQLANQSTVYPYIYPIADIIMCKFNPLLPAWRELFASLETLMKGVADLALGTCGE